jgi:hypothetical protein
MAETQLTTRNNVASLGSVDDHSTLAQIEEYGKRLKEALG